MAPLSTVQGDMIGSAEVATVSGPAITAFNDNWKGPGIGIGGPSLQASVRWGSGKPVEGNFVTTDSQETLQIYSGNTLIGPGVYPLHVTIHNNGKTVASLSENITKGKAKGKGKGIRGRGQVGDRKDNLS